MGCSNCSKAIFVILVILSLNQRLAWSYMVQNDTEAMMYLERFGYIEHEDMDPHMGMKEAQPMLMAFQKMCNINQTGELDSKTMEMMNAPRCGNKDMRRVPVNESDLSSNRVKRYKINEYNAKWRKREVTYKMGMFSSEMQKHVTQDQVLMALHTAFRLWSEVTNLDFVYLPCEMKVDIELSFTTRDHMQDGYPFDGPGKVLAHAFPPGEGLGGDVHFEDEEEWHVHSPKGTDVLFVAVHEIGHALGLSHSSTKGAIMSAFYAGYKPHLKLHPDDINGIQALYGRREIPLKMGHNPETDSPCFSKPSSRFKPIMPPRPLTTARPTTTTTRPSTTTPSRPPTTTWTPLKAWTTATTTSIYTSKQTTPREPMITTTHFRGLTIGKRPQKVPNKEKAWLRPDLCTDSKIDAITTLKDGKIYAFKDSYVFQVDSKGEGILPGWPNHIGAIFQGLDSNIDAAATRPNGKTYFFKGSKYWRFTGTKMDPGYPKIISKNFVGIPDNIDAVFIYLDGFYFIKGDKFWRFNPKNKPHIDVFYPLPISYWGLDTASVDAAFHAPNDEIYFFKDSVYYRFDQRTFKIAQADPAYPRSTRVMWFGCTQYRPDARNIRNDYYSGDNGDYEGDDGYDRIEREDDGGYYFYH